MGRAQWLTFVLGNHSRVDTKRFLEVHRQTGAAADRQANYTGSVRRVYRGRQTERKMARRISRETDGQTQADQDAILHIIAIIRNRFQFQRWKTVQKVSSGGYLWDWRNLHSVMDGNDSSAASVLRHLRKWMSTLSEDVADCDCEYNSINIILTCGV